MFKTHLQERRSVVFINDVCWRQAWSQRKWRIRFLADLWFRFTCHPPTHPPPQNLLYREKITRRGSERDPSKTTEIKSRPLLLLYSLRGDMELTEEERPHRAQRRFLELNNKYPARSTEHYPRWDDSVGQRRSVPGPGEGEGWVPLHRLTGGPGAPALCHPLPETGTPLVYLLSYTSKNNF